MLYKAMLAISLWKYVNVLKLIGLDNETTMPDVNAR